MTGRNAGGRLAGQVAVITGGGSGIGRGLVLGFAQEGARVAVLERDPVRGRAVVEAVAAAGGDARWFDCDVSRAEQVTRAVTAAADEYGSIDVLVNNAGITTTAPLGELSLRQWSETIAVDLTGVFLMTQAVSGVMMGQRRGRIINIASQLGLRGAPQMAHYCAAKAGVLGLTRACARELVAHGIRVNAIAPGPTMTENLAGVPQGILDEIRSELPIECFAARHRCRGTLGRAATRDRYQ
ncbi:SDR family NAD(P)-dependent oxidoreductase [Pseudonocardia hispaniensis]|uniref:SDR family NAD(P)-dependent oxidoreductase n=1 Tax=Pseudonocardia hispaniensis TaxID=904933 RepID=A0ABW1IYX8_9PSEU